MMKAASSGDNGTEVRVATEIPPGHGEDLVGGPRWRPDKRRGGRAKPRSKAPPPLFPLAVLIDSLLYFAELKQRWA